MKFSKFEELFKKKYPYGKVVAHGKFAGTQKNGKTTLIFFTDGRCYEYYGAYEDILNRIGIKVISKSRYNDIVMTLENYRSMNGRPKLFEKDGCEDYSKDISRLEAEIEEINNNYLIV